MTNREFLTAISTASVIETEYMHATREDLIAFAQAEIAKLDARNDKRRNTLSKTQEANEGLKVEILSAIANGKHLAAEIGAEIGVSTQKASALLALLVKDGKVKSSDFKVKGKGSVKSYSLTE